MGYWNPKTHYLCKHGCGENGNQRRILKKDAVVSPCGRLYCPDCGGRLSVVAKKEKQQVYPRI